MSKVLIVAEHLDGKLNASTAKCVSAAQALKPESIDILVLAADPSGVAGEGLKTTHYAAPAKRSKGVMVKDAAELVAALKQKGLL